MILNIESQNISYRHATLNDAAAIRDILGYYIENTNASWRYQVMGLSVFEGWVRSHQKPERPFIVAEYNHMILGYSCLSDFRSGEGYWPCAENSVYVRPEYQDLGIGKKLMQLVLDEGRAAGVKAVIAAIDAENVSSIKFHEQFGFYQCGYLKNIGRKHDNWLSLVLLQCDLS